MGYIFDTALLYIIFIALLFWFVNLLFTWRENLKRSTFAKVTKTRVQTGSEEG